MTQWARGRGICSRPACERVLAIKRCWLKRGETYDGIRMRKREAPGVEQRNNYAVAIQTHTAFRKTATAPRYSLICVLPKLYLFSTSAYYRCTGGERSEGREEEEEEEERGRKEKADLLSHPTTQPSLSAYLNVCDQTKMECRSIVAFRRGCYGGGRCGGCCGCCSITNPVCSEPEIVGRR